MSPVDAEPTSVAWWGVGEQPPHERWPGVTIPINDGGGQYYFNATLADRVCAFFPRYCSHSKGQFAGRAFMPLEYQIQLILRPIFGWVRVANGLRRFQKAYIQIPKKNGKTQLVAGLALYMLLGDNEPGAEVYVAAADKEQARILFDAAKAMVENSPALAKRLVVYRNRIVRADDPNAFFQVLSREAATKHGPNIHCLIIDELHAQPDRDLFETLTRGVIARLQPVIIEITTAGDDDESICFEEYDYARRVLSGTIQDERHLPVIFESSPKDDWTDPLVLQRVNPGVGTTITLDTLTALALEAKNEPRKRNDFLRYHTNQWTGQATAWIPIEWWDACNEHVPADDELNQWPCAVGIDMAQKIDLASGVAVFKLPLDEDEEPLTHEVLCEGDIDAEIATDTTGGVIHKRTLSLDYQIVIVPAFWLPEDTLRERARQDGVRYDLWADEMLNGEPLLRIVDGAVVGAEPIVNYLAGTSPKTGLIARFQRLKQSEFAYDPAFATDVALSLRDLHNLTVVEVPQNYKHLSEACQVFEALVKAKRVRHGGHKLLRWNLENVNIKTDDAGRIRPVKPRKATKRIDGIVATLIALTRLMSVPLVKLKKKRKGALVYTPSGFVPAVPPDTASPAHP